MLWEPNPLLEGCPREAGGPLRGSQVVVRSSTWSSDCQLGKAAPASLNLGLGRAQNLSRLLLPEQATLLRHELTARRRRLALSPLSVVLNK